MNSTYGVWIQTGWGRLIFAHTFPDPASVAAVLKDEQPGRRDIAFYVTDPHLILNSSPSELFLDPSNTYRLDLTSWQPDGKERGFSIREADSVDELLAANRIYQQQNMVPLDVDVVWQQRDDQRMKYFLAVDGEDQVLGVAMAVDHAACFDDLFNSGSLWALAVDPQAGQPGIGLAIVQHIAAHLKGCGRAIMDLSVMHDNKAAIGLYESLGFERVHVLAIKRRNQINERLFVPSDPLEGYNPYAAIIIREALRRGIAVDPIDPPRGYFVLSLGSRRVTCRESLTEATSAVAMSRCADKRLTNELLAAGGLSVPRGLVVKDEADAEAMLQEFGSVVIKPVDGEQGQGVAVGLRSIDEVRAAIAVARQRGGDVLCEQYVEGEDLRVVVINFEVVAAAIRQPATIVGTGRHSAQELIERVSRRRAAATGGESRIPVDDETLRSLREASYEYDSIIPQGMSLQVRQTANLHTGGTIHDCTSSLHPTLAEASVRAARILNIPVVGLDLIVKSVDQPDYVIIEANERPGLANHEPQPTAERLIDMLFPLTIPSADDSVPDR